MLICLFAVASFVFGCQGQDLQWLVKLHSLPTSLIPLENELGVTFGQYLSSLQFVVLADESFGQRAEKLDIVAFAIKRGQKRKIPSKISPRQTHARASAGCDLVVRLIQGKNISAGAFQGFDNTVIGASAEKLIVNLPLCSSPALDLASSQVSEKKSYF